MELPPILLDYVLQYGYLAVFVGCLLEGDILVLGASFLAYTSNLDLPLIMVAAFFGTWLSDMSWFVIGRYVNNETLKKWSWLHKMSSQSLIIVSARPRALALSFRFMYGLRMIIPFSLGRTAIPTSTFIIYNTLGILIWVAILSTLGYFFASLTETVFGQMKHLKIILPLVVVTTLLLFIYASHIIEYALKIYPKREAQ